jgi:hypothetical protein
MIAARPDLSVLAIAAIFRLIAATPAVAQDQPAAPAAPPAVAPDQATPQPNPAPKNLEPLPSDSIAILGKKVRAPNGEDLGLIVDAVVDNDGRPRAAIIDFGGFLGVGSRKIAVDWRLLHFQPGDQNRQVSLSLGRSAIKAAPEYKLDAPGAEMVGPLDASAPTDADR